MSLSSSPSQWGLYLLGSWRLERAGQPLHLSRRKVRLLLAYLALHPESHSRDQLAALLWSDTGDFQARASFRTTLVALRREIDPEILLVERETVQLNPDFPLWVDAWALANGCTQLTGWTQRGRVEPSTLAELQATLALYRGDLLSEYYDDWVLAAREQFRTWYLDALLFLTQAFRTASAYEPAIEAARKILATDPANERAYQHLMFCQLALGNRHSAFEIYEQCVRALREELAVEPSPETTALAQWLKQIPATPTLAAKITNLPMALTSFVGRAREMAEVKQWLTGNAHTAIRLLTLTGAGGSGKTRLAIQVATDLIDAFHDGVWWVELAALSDPQLVPQAVAKALGLRESPTQSLSETLVQALQAKQLLLVLDNCEHLVLACAQLAETLLTQCPRLQIVATSREPLGLTGEQIWTVPLLSVPSAEPASLAALLMEFESIRLFVDRARVVQADFALDEQNALAVAQICRRLDGIPLAIELAAARVNTLTPAQLAVQLDDRFNLLVAGNRTAWPRQQTLRALLDWSYDLLSEEERVLFRRLVVFSGGRNLEEVEQVCAEAPLAPAHMCDLLERLVAKSLLVAEEQNGTMRYGFLDTIKQYACDKLKDSGEEARVRHRHLEYFITLAEAAEPRLQGPEQAEWLNRLEVEHNNLRAALRFALAQDDSAEVLRLCIALKSFWQTRGYWNEAREWLAQACAQARARLGPTASPALRARYGWAQACASFFADMQGDTATAQGLADESWALFRELQDRRGLAFALARQGSLAYSRSDNTRARELWAESVTLWRAVGDRYWIAATLQQLGMVTRRLGDYAAARGLLEESLALARQAADAQTIAGTLNSLGVVAYHQSDYAAAQQFYTEAAQLYRGLDSKYSAAGVLLNLGNVALARGDRATARSSFEESLAEMRKIGDRRTIALLLVSLGDVMRWQGDYVAARPILTEGLELQRKLGDKRGIALGLKGLALLDWMEGNHARAGRELDEGVALARAANDPETITGLLCVLGHVRASQGEPSAAQAALAEGLILARTLGVKMQMVTGLLGLARLASEAGQFARGLELAAAAGGLLEAIQGRLDPFDELARDQVLAAARAQLDSDAYQDAWEEGRALILEQAIELALQ